MPDLPRSLDTEYFAVRCSDDEGDLAGLCAALEGSYPRIVDRLGVALPEKARIDVYPDIAAYRRASGRSAGDWEAGCFSKGTVKIVSPHNPGSVHTYDGVLKIAVHEFVHLAANAIPIRGRRPPWLEEGVAVYEAGQGANEQYVKTLVMADRVPSLHALERDFVKSKGYLYSHTIIEFIVSEHGYAGLRRLMRNPSDFVGALGVSRAIFEQGWRAYLKRKYDSQPAQASPERPHKPVSTPR